MRVATYTIPAAARRRRPASAASSSSGRARAAPSTTTSSRWVGAVRGPRRRRRRRSSTVNGLKVHTHRRLRDLPRPGRADDAVAGQEARLAAPRRDRRGAGGNGLLQVRRPLRDDREGGEGLRGAAEVGHEGGARRKGRAGQVFSSCLGRSRGRNDADPAQYRASSSRRLPSCAPRRAMQSSIPSSTWARLRGPPGSFSPGPGRTRRPPAGARASQKPAAKYGMNPVALARHARDDRVVVRLHEVPRGLAARRRAERREEDRVGLARVELAGEGERERSFERAPDPRTRRARGRAGCGRAAPSRPSRPRDRRRRARGRRDAPALSSTPPAISAATADAVRRATRARAAAPRPGASGSSPSRRDERHERARAGAAFPRLSPGLPRSRGRAPARRRSSRRSARSAGRRSSGTSWSPDVGGDPHASPATICRSESPAKRGTSASASAIGKRARHRESVDVAQEPDALGDRQLRVGDREELRRAGRPGRARGSSRARRRWRGPRTGSRRRPRRRHRARGVRQERAAAASAPSRAAARADRDLPGLARRRPSSRPGGSASARATAVRRRRRAVERDVDDRHARLVEKASRTPPRRPDGSPPRSPARKSCDGRVAVAVRLDVRADAVAELRPARSTTRTSR